LAFSFTPAFKRWMRLALFVAYAQFIVYPLLFLGVRDPEITGLGTLCVVILLIYVLTFSRMGFPYAALTGLLLVIAWLAVLAQPGMAPIRLLAGSIATLLSAFAGTLVAGYFIEYSIRRDFVQRRMLAAERERSDRLLLNILPPEIAERLKDHAEAIADQFAESTVLFADIVEFTSLASRISPAELVGMLNAVFTCFDDLAARHGLEKIKTIGDAYMVVGGVPTPRADHAVAVASMALDMCAALAELQPLYQHKLRVRIGIDRGPVVAGVIGRQKFAYDLWGDTVNTASRMESHGLPDRIHVTRAVYERLNTEFVFEPRGSIEVKGKGAMVTYFLVGHRRSGSY
jgi:class 3 adenylate cyclase